MKKGVAVSQLILLILGIIVLAVIAYLIYVNFISSSSTFDAEKCRAKALGLCTSCKIANTKVADCKFPTKDETPDKWVGKCGGDPEGGGQCNFDSTIPCQYGVKIECTRLGVDLTQ